MTSPTARIPRLLAVALLAFGALLCTVAVAHGATVSGGVSDPRGDASSEQNLHPFDLASFSLRYDDAGKVTASFSYHDSDTGTEPWFSFSVKAHVGVWSRAQGTCDATSPGGLKLTLLPYFDAPTPPYSYVKYRIAGYKGGEDQWVELFATYDNGVYGFAFADAQGLARRGYNCVTNVVLVNGSGEQDRVDGAFCMGPQGTVSCPATPTPIGIAWSSPFDPQTVSGFLHEGRSTCWAEATGPIVRTENWVDGRLNDRQSHAPWGCEWNTRTVANGLHTLTVKAYTADGRMTQDSVRVYVFNPAPQPPRGLRVTGVGSGAVTLDWSDSTDLRHGDTYQVYVNGRVVARSVAASAYTARGLANGVSHSFRVSAGQPGSYGDWTAPVTATPRA